MIAFLDPWRGDAVMVGEVMPPSWQVLLASAVARKRPATSLLAVRAQRESCTPITLNAGLR
jgi:hypothetical protein